MRGCLADDTKIYTCTVGLKSSCAHFYLEPTEVMLTLKKLKQQELKKHNTRA